MSIVCILAAVLSLFSFRLTGWVLLKLFNSFFWNIQIHKGQLEMVKAATEARISGTPPFCSPTLAARP